MSAFARATFDAAAYLAHRPRYPTELVDVVLKYHSSSPHARFSSAIDLGCGPGQLTTQLAKHFDHTLGLDTSKGMVEKGMRAPEGAKGRVEYRVGSAEDLVGVKDGSVDLVTAAQAAHWFDPSKVFPELLRVLRPGGSVAYIGYAGIVLPEYPETRNLIIEYTEKRLEPYWEPGRKHVDRCYDTISFPPASLSSSHGSFDPSSFRRLKFDLHPSFPPRSDVPSEPDGAEHFDLIMSHRWKFSGLRKYLNTWSAAHTFDEKEGKGAGGEGVADRFFEELIGKIGVRKEEVEEKEVTAAFPAAVLLMRKEG